MADPQDRDLPAAPPSPPHDTRDAPRQDRDDDAPNPPRTTSGGITAPKFGSAGSGGAELEPGPERD